MNIQAIELQTVVVTGRAEASDHAQVPASVATVDTYDLTLVQASHINEVGDRMAGVWLSRGNGQEHLTAIRSPVLTGPGSCGAFLVLQDGVPTRPAGFCNVNQLFEINSEQASGIEVMKGPGSSLYGSNALHGVINVLMPEAKATQRSSIRLDAGPHDYARAFAQYSDGQSMVISGHVDHDGGDKHDSGFEQQKFSLKQQLDHHELQESRFIEVTNLRQETAGYLNGYKAYQDDSRKRDNGNPEAYRNANAIHFYDRVSGGRDGMDWSVTPYANASDTEFVMHWVPGAVKPVEQNNHQALGVDVRYAWQPTNALTMNVGGSVEAGRVSLKQSVPTAIHYDFDVWMYSAGLWTELDYAINQQWRWVNGLRYDHRLYRYDSRIAAGTTGNYTRLADRDDEFSDYSFNSGLIWDWQEQHQSYVSVSRGYRAPQLAELYRLEGGTPASLVDSEYLSSMELGFRGYFAHGQRQVLLYDVSLFSMRKDNVIIKDSSRQYLGNAETSHRGLEVGLEYRFVPGAYLKLNATYAEHRYRDLDDQLFGSPAVDLEHNLIDTAPRYFGGIQLGKAHSWGLVELEWRQMGAYYLDPQHDFDYEGHGLLNARVQIWPASDWRINARLLNLTNRDYAERADVVGTTPRYFVGEARSLYLSVEKQF